MVRDPMRSKATESVDGGYDVRKSISVNIPVMFDEPVRDLTDARTRIRPTNLSGRDLIVGAVQYGQLMPANHVFISIGDEQGPHTHWASIHKCSHASA